MAKVYHIDLTSNDRNKLQSIAKKRLSTSEASKRSHILLAADRLGDKCWTDAEISAKYNVSIRTIERLRQRYVEEGLAVCLSGKPRPNLDKIKFDAQVEAHLVAIRCSTPPEGYSSWTLKLLGERLVSLEYVESISQESVRKILKKTKLSLGG